MIDVLAPSEAYLRFEIHGIGLIWGDQNPVHSLNKLKGKRMIDFLIDLRIEDTYVVQWIDQSKL